MTWQRWRRSIRTGVRIWCCRCLWLALVLVLSLMFGGGHMHVGTDRAIILGIRLLLLLSHKWSSLAQERLCSCMWGARAVRASGALVVPNVLWLLFGSDDLFLSSLLESYLRRLRSVVARALHPCMRHVPRRAPLATERQRTTQRDHADHMEMRTVHECVCSSSAPRPTRLDGREPARRGAAARIAFCGAALLALAALHWPRARAASPFPEL